MLAASPATAVLNADDPLVADLGRDRPGTLYFGVSDDSLALAGLAHAADAKHCRNCGAPYVFDAVYLGHLGDYHCPAVAGAGPSLKSVRRTSRLEGVRAAAFTLRTPAGTSEVRLALPGLYNVYNALAAAALASSLEVPLETIVAGLQATQPAFGRAETVAVALGEQGPGASAPPTRELRIMLVKNPAGANEVCARSPSSPAGMTCWACSTTRLPTGATSRGSGMRTSSCSPGGSGASCAAAAARRTWPPA